MYTIRDNCLWFLNDLISYEINDILDFFSKLSSNSILEIMKHKEKIMFHEDPKTDFEIVRLRVQTTLYQ